MSESGAAAGAETNTKLSGPPGELSGGSDITSTLVYFCNEVCDFHYNSDYYDAANIKNILNIKS